MNKRLLKIVSVCLIVLLCISPASFSYAAEQHTSVEYLANGDFIETIVTIYPVQSRANFSISGNKTSTYTEASGQAAWSVTVYGTFSYTPGIGSTCIFANGTASSYSLSWSVTSPFVSYSGNTAQATSTANHYKNGSLFETLNRTAILTCDSYGNLF